MGCKLHFHDIASFTRTRFNRNIMGCKERIIERLFDDSGDLIGT